MAGIAEELAEKYNHLIAHCNDCYSSDPNDTELFTSAINEAIERAAQEAEKIGKGFQLSASVGDDPDNNLPKWDGAVTIAAAIRRLKGE